MRVTALLVVVVVCAIAAVGATDAATSPQALRVAILKAEGAKRSVHYLIVGSQAGARVQLVADVARDRGIQRFTFSKHGRTGHLTEILVHSKAYFRGDAFAWRVLTPASVASHNAGKWVSVAPSSPEWVVVEANMTIGSFVIDEMPDTRLSLVRGTAGGRALRGLRGTGPNGGVIGSGPEGGTLTIYLPESGPPLPVEETEVEVAGLTPPSGRATFSRWNEPVHVQAPTHSVPVQP